MGHFAARGGNVALLRLANVMEVKEGMRESESYPSGVLTARTPILET